MEFVIATVVCFHLSQRSEIRSVRTFFDLIPVGKTISGKKALITDGPYAESKELVGGYFVVKANSLDEAVEIAKQGYPDFIFNGAVEVREVMKF